MWAGEGGFFFKCDILKRKYCFPKKPFVSKGFDPPKSPLLRGTSEFLFGSLLVKEG